MHSFIFSLLFNSVTYNPGRDLGLDLVKILSRFFKSRFLARSGQELEKKGQDYVFTKYF